MSRSLVCHLLPVAWLVETSTTNHVFLWFSMTFTLTKYIESISYFYRDFPFNVRYESVLKLHLLKLPSKNRSSKLWTVEFVSMLSD